MVSFLLPSSIIIFLSHTIYYISSCLSVYPNMLRFKRLTSCLRLIPFTASVTGLKWALRGLRFTDSQRILGQSMLSDTLDYCCLSSLIHPLSFPLDCHIGIAALSYQWNGAYVCAVADAVDSALPFGERTGIYSQKSHGPALPLMLSHISCISADSRSPRTVSVHIIPFRYYHTSVEGVAPSTHHGETSSL